MSARPPVAKASLFVTCLVDQFFPEIGESTVRVLRHLGVDVDFPADQTCCGQTAFNAGHWREARPLALRFLDLFGGNRYIVAPSGSCASMVRKFYGELLQDQPEALEAWTKLAPRVFELSEFIVDVLDVSDLGVEGLGTNRKVTYHEACHLRRELGVTIQPRALIDAIPSLDLSEMDQAEVCCGFGGTFSVKYADISGAMLRDKLANIVKTGADTLVACDSSCLMHLAGGIDKQGMNVRPMHLAQLLDEAIGSRS